MTRKKLSLLDPALCREACKGAVRKLDPRSQWQIR